MEEIKMTNTFEIENLNKAIKQLADAIDAYDASTALKTFNGRIIADDGIEFFPHEHLFVLREEIRKLKVERAESKQQARILSLGLETDIGTSDCNTDQNNNDNEAAKVALMDASNAIEKAIAHFRRTDQENRNER